MTSSDIHLSPFEGFRDLKDDHENLLTRALLVLLRASPAAHGVWLRHVDAATEPPHGKVGPLSLEKLEPATWFTQVGTIGTTSEAVRESEVDVRSVRLAPGISGPGVAVRHSDRGGIYDAVIAYGETTYVVVENKLTDEATQQHEQLKLAGLATQASTGDVSWRELLADLHGQLSRPDLLTPAEGFLLDEFLTFVERRFPGLGPDRNLELAGTDRGRQVRRLRALLTEAAGADASSDRYGAFLPIAEGEGAVARRLYLVIEDERVRLAVFPGDITSQARTFYGSQDLVDRVLGLTNLSGWSTRPNFHLGHMQRRVMDMDGTSASSEVYIKYWVTNASIPRAHRPGLGEPDWDSAWREWIDLGFADATDRQRFEQAVGLNQSYIDIRPGLALERSWPLDVARTLDASGGFVHETRRALSELQEYVGVTVAQED